MRPKNRRKSSSLRSSTPLELASLGLIFLQSPPLDWVGFQTLFGASSFPCFISREKSIWERIKNNRWKSRADFMKNLSASIAQNCGVEWFWLVGKRRFDRRVEWWEIAQVAHSTLGLASAKTQTVSVSTGDKEGQLGEGLRSGRGKMRDYHLSARLWTPKPKINRFEQSERKPT